VAEIQEKNDKLAKLQNNGLSINWIIKTIRTTIATQLYYIMANSFMLKKTSKSN
jgi:hypothetical protein